MQRACSLATTRTFSEAIDISYPLSETNLGLYIYRLSPDANSVGLLRVPSVPRRAGHVDRLALYKLRGVVIDSLPHESLLALVSMLQILCASKEGVLEYGTMLHRRQNINIEVVPRMVLDSLGIGQEG